MYRLRDERGVFSDIWASGIMRRAALGAGRRVADRGGVHDPEHMVDASLDEMCALVRGASAPSADELAERVAARLALGPKDAPATLGPPPPPPPDPSGLPPGVGRVMARRRHRDGRDVRQLRGRARGEPAARTWRRAAASTRGRRAASPGRRSSAGSCRATCSSRSRRSEAFNILLPLLGAIVTDAGGLLSHSAIVAREYGIPGVVGTREGDRPHPRRCPRPCRRRRGRSPRVLVASRSMPEVVPLCRRARGRALRRQGHRSGRGRPRGAADPARHRALGHHRRRRSPPATTTPIAAVLDAARGLPTPLAVRSSAVDEDGAEASFAGQHLTLLNVPSLDDVPSAVRQIWWSANSDSAITLPPAGRPVHPAERRCRRAVAPRARHRRRDVHDEPDQRRRRTARRGGLGSR